MICFPHMNKLALRSIRHIVFKEDGIWYAVALELNIVESGDDPREALILLFEAVKGYVTSAFKNNLSADVLNQTPDGEYETLWRKLQAHMQIPSPYTVFTHGESTLANL